MVWKVATLDVTVLSYLTYYLAAKVKSLHAGSTTFLHRLSSLADLLVSISEQEQSSLILLIHILHGLP